MAKQWNPTINSWHEETGITVLFRIKTPVHVAISIGVTVVSTCKDSKVHRKTVKSVSEVSISVFPLFTRYLAKSRNQTVLITTTGSQNVSINGGLSAFHFFSSLRFPIRERLINEKGKHRALGGLFSLILVGFMCSWQPSLWLFATYISSRLQLKDSQRK